ncbi:MAG: methyltransferase family protein [Candidatus Hodarchaeota archaeon]
MSVEKARSAHYEKPKLRENKMYWFLVSMLGFFVMIFLHFRSVEHTKLQEKYGKEGGIRLGKIYAMISSLEFVFWVGLWVSPQQIFVIPMFSDFVVSIANLSTAIPNLIISLPLILVGAWFGIKGVRETGLKLAETHCSPKKILKTGVYSTLRHPQYFGWILAHVGISVFLSVYYSILFSPVLIAVIYLLSRKEEEELIKEFGNEYKDYQREVPMLLPRRKIFELKKS